MRWTLACAAALATLIPTFAVSLAGAEEPGEVNIYSYRQPYLIEPLLKEFSDETGIKTNVIFAEKGLIERIEAEGRNSPADVLLTVDIGNLSQAVTSGIAQPIESKTVIDAVPPAYRGDNNEWIGLTRRARVVYASKDRVEEETITYEDLADPKWRGKICIRSGQHSYNVALIASMIAHHGEEKTEEWLRGVKANLARKPAGNDRLQVKGVYVGECDLAIGNTYYMGLMLNNEAEPEQKEWAAASRIIYPDAEGAGTQVNVSGAVLSKWAPNRQNGEKLIEFLLSDEAQQLYANANYEYPVVPDVQPDELVLSWGELNASEVPLTEVAAQRDAAAALVDELRFNEGPQD